MREGDGVASAITRMKLTAKILKFKGKKLETVEEVRATIIAILEDIECGDITVTEAKPIQDEIKEVMRKLRPNKKRKSQGTRPRSSHSLGSRERHGVHART